MLKKKKAYKVAIMGATGVVGQEMIETLEERKFPAEELRLFASERSAGATASYLGKEIVIEKLADNVFAGIDIVLGATSSDQTPYCVAPRCFTMNGDRKKLTPAT